MKETVIVGLSGGVDSAVAALLLQQQGYRVEALFMKNWEEDDNPEYCSAAQDLSDARQIAEKLDIPLHTVNFSAEYWDRVFSYFLDEYRAGRTPNPDVLCNREIKFKAFLDYALSSLGASKIATGHYARIQHQDEKYYLTEAADKNKDQTYFLYLLNQFQLSHSLFPLGNLDKPAVRQLAREAGFANHQKKDSTGICFIGERKFRDFLANYIPANPGNILTTEGDVIGRHNGLMYYTLGQRQGLHIGGVRDADNSPWFVARKNLQDNTLIVVQGNQHPLLMTTTLDAEQLHWITNIPNATGFHCLARCRHRQPLQDCHVKLHPDKRCEVTFTTPQRAPTPGQSIVFYHEQRCLGGGIIAGLNL